MDGNILGLRVFGRALDEAGRMWDGSGSEQGAEFLQVEGFANIEEAENAEVAFGEHCGEVLSEVGSQQISEYRTPGLLVRCDSEFSMAPACGLAWWFTALFRLKVDLNPHP